MVTNLHPSEMVWPSKGTHTIAPGCDNLHTNARGQIGPRDAEPGESLVGPPHHGIDPLPNSPRSPYPAALPPPLPYPPGRRRARLITGVSIALAAIAGIAATVVLGVRDDGVAPRGALTPAAAEQAIQNYLNALSDGDVQAISRNMLCGLYDGVTDRRTDDALAKLSSETFRKQFSRADVTSVDTIVFTSETSAQVLFTMKAAPAAGNRSDDGAERQAVAQLMAHGGDLLVCSYVQRTAGTF
jgi:hypothetical protein